MTDVIEVTITYDTPYLARAAASALVSDRLAACVHVSGPIESTYWWEGEVQCEPEWRLTAKTSPAKVDQAVAALIAGHPYDLPGLVIHPCRSTPDFADWVAREASGSGSGPTPDT